MDASIRRYPDSGWKHKTEVKLNNSSLVELRAELASAESGAAKTSKPKSSVDDTDPLAQYRAASGVSKLKLKDGSSRPRQSKKKTDRDYIPAGSNADVLRRAQRDEAQHISQQPSLASSQAALERKARLYDALKAGGGAGLSEVVEGQLLVDFVRKKQVDDQVAKKRGTIAPRRIASDDDADDGDSSDSDLGPPRKQVPSNPPSASAGNSASTSALPQPSYISVPSRAVNSANPADPPWRKHAPPLSNPSAVPLPPPSLYPNPFPPPPPFPSSLYPNSTAFVAGPPTPAAGSPFQLQETPPTLPTPPKLPTESDDDPDPLVSYIDEYGRARKVPRSQLPLHLRPRTPTPPPEEEEARLAAMNDAQRAAYELSKLVNEGGGYAISSSDHYDASKETRNLGVGFYKFSQDEDERARQREELDKLRNETVEARKKREREEEEAKGNGAVGGTTDKRQKRMEERRKLIEKKKQERGEKKGKEAEDFLSGVLGQLGAAGSFPPGDDGAGNAVHFVMRIALPILLLLGALVPASLADSAHDKLRMHAREEYLSLARHFSVVTADEHLERLVKRNNGGGPKIGILSAFAPETLASLKVMNETGTVKILEKNGRQFFEGTLRGKPVVLSTSGVGMSNAAMTTQMMFDYYPSIQYFVFSGIGGGVNPDLKVGDVTIPRKWAQYQHNKFINNQLDESLVSVDFPNKFYSYNDSVTGKFIRVAYMEPSYKFCGNETLTTNLTYPGFAVPMEVDTLVNATDAFASVSPQQFWFPVDPYLLSAAQAALPKLPNLTATGFDPISQSNFTLPHQPKVQIGKSGISASTFVDNADIREQLFFYHGADVLDMESAAVMHVCKSNQKPCIVIRSLSDLAGGQEGVNAILTFINFAAKNSAVILFGLLDEIKL
ncbi:hypothetical protein HDU93_003022 [Gonapodya sp. JEL0774]|nr:hypothetical protein HDU93_003022 [Gonapodya sp. JEL0774]